MSDPRNDIATRHTIDTMVETYQTACQMIDQGYKLLSDARTLLEGVFGDKDHNVYMDTIDYYARKEGTDAAENVKLSLRRKIWKSILDRLGIWKFCSISQADELRRRLDTGDVGEIRTDVIFDMLVGLASNSETYQVQAIKEVFKFLHVFSPTYGKHYKTNDKNARFALGKKIILTGIIEIIGWGEHFIGVNHYRRDEICSVDRVFHLLDGKDFPENVYNSPLLQAIETSGSDGLGSTEYFSFRVYLNGNLHLTFRRMDLLQELNRIAATEPYLKDGK